MYAILAIAMVAIVVLWAATTQTADGRTPVVDDREGHP